MIRKIGLTLLFAGNLFTSNIFAVTNHEFRQGLGIEYELPVNEPQIFSNIFLWTIKATCTVITESSDSLVSVTMLRKGGTLNNKQLLTNVLETIVVQPGDKLNISAEPGAKVELVNYGLTTIKANCSTA